MNTIKITVEGIAGSGKSTIMHIIKNALDKECFSNITITDAEGDRQNVISINTLNQRIFSTINKTSNVKIVEKRRIRDTF